MEDYNGMEQKCVTEVSILFLVSCGEGVIFSC